MKTTKKLVSPSTVEDEIYVVPTEATYMLTRIDKTKTWSDVYGKHRCTRCGKKLVPGDAYTAKCVKFRGGWTIDVTHVDLCEPPQKKQRKNHGI